MIIYSLYETSGVFVGAHITYATSVEILMKIIKKTFKKQPVRVIRDKFDIFVIHNRIKRRQVVIQAYRIIPIDVLESPPRKCDHILKGQPH